MADEAKDTKLKEQTAESLGIPEIVLEKLQVYAEDRIGKAEKAFPEEGVTPENLLQSMKDNLVGPRTGYFEGMDTSADGKIDADEVAASRMSVLQKMQANHYMSQGAETPKQMAESFTENDIRKREGITDRAKEIDDGDGKVSREELIETLATMWKEGQNLNHQAGFATMPLKSEFKDEPKPPSPDVQATPTDGVEKAPPPRN